MSQRLLRGTGGSLPLARWSSQTSAALWEQPSGAPSCVASARSLTLCSNSTWMLPALSRCVTRASALLDVGAYVHWYERFGIEAEHVRIAVESVAEVIDAYSEASGSGARAAGVQRK